MNNKCNCNECENFEQCEIMIILHNPVYKVDTYYQGGSIDLGCFNGGTHFKIEKGDKIAQILLKEHKTWIIGIENNNERIGGFGSTDIK